MMLSVRLCDSLRSFHFFLFSFQLQGMSVVSLSAFTFLGWRRLVLVQ